MGRMRIKWGSGGIKPPVRMQLQSEKLALTIGYKNLFIIHLLLISKAFQGQHANVHYNHRIY